MALESASKKVRLCFKATGLKDLDTFSKSDPYLVLLSVEADGRSREVGRTETIMNDLNPTWATSIVVPYYFEMKQTYRLFVYDDDGHKDDKKNDLAGSVDFLLSHVVCARGRTKTFNLDTQGTVVIMYEEVGGSAKDQIAIEFYGRNLKKMSLFGTSPYLVINRLLPNGSLQVLYRTETKEGLSPKWRITSSLAINELHSGDFEQQTLEVQCFGARTLLRDVSLGSFRCSVAELKRAAIPGAGVSSGGPPFRLMLEKGKREAILWGHPRGKGAGC